jgi:hypothetical protein
MLCSRCGYLSDEGERFCRNCGALIAASALAAKRPKHLSYAMPKDPDEMTGNGIGSVFVGDGFLIVAVILAATSSSISGLLWLLLLIPAFFFFGKGFADVLHARQIRRRMKHEALGPGPSLAPVVGDIIQRSNSGKVALLSVTEKTTRDLE